MREAALVLAVLLLPGCVAYGGVGSARVSDGTLTTSSRSVSAGTGGVETRSSRTIADIDLLSR